MRKIRSRLMQWSGALVLSLAFSGCGGGSGGGAGDQASQTGTSPLAGLASAVSVSLNGTPFVHVERLQGNTGKDQLLDIAASGPLQGLQGATLYVIVEDPSSLFQATPDVQLHPHLDGAFVTLRSGIVDVPGRYRGDLKVHVCLDSACAAELSGSPMKVPYDVTVLRGVQLDRENIDIALPFGQIPPDQTVTTTLPASLQDWFINKTTVHQSERPLTQVAISRTTTPDLASGAVTFKIQPGTTGEHLETFEIGAITRMPDGTPDISRKTVTLRYTVTRNPAVTFVFFPAEGHYTVGFGDPAATYTPNPMIADVFTELTRVEYVSQPEAANGHVLANSWFSTFDFRINGCTPVGSALACLPAGTYVARLHYTVGEGGGQQDVYWPITLEVAPR